MIKRYAITQDGSVGFRVRELFKDKDEIFVLTISNNIPKFTKVDCRRVVIVKGEIEHFFTRNYGHFDNDEGRWVEGDMSLKDNSLKNIIDEHIHYVYERLPNCAKPTFGHLLNYLREIKNPSEYDTMKNVRALCKKISCNIKIIDKWTNFTWLPSYTDDGVFCEELSKIADADMKKYNHNLKAKFEDMFNKGLLDL